ncbi:Zn-ribbon domain-containing OB-fold protein [Acuticoccus kandeliae]|uniref:Zn-ribbon domain-containing OB-fold protein n=1 Tax=Acuticoccus kandeliae TaxID=2073160 RepID=UPI000D3E169B|nr:OB-fold domain-containing protein [Acuticoccus kandeliae]
MTERTLPVPDALTEPFWQAAREKRLLLQKCPRTGAFQWYPRAHSLAAPHETPEWVEASGKGTVFSYSVVHYGGEGIPTPYVCALVELEEGPLVFTHLVDVPDDRLAIGLPVEVSFEDLNETISLPVFTERVSA